MTHLTCFRDERLWTMLLIIVDRTVYMGCLVILDYKILRDIEITCDMWRWHATYLLNSDNEVSVT